MTLLTPKNKRTFFGLLVMFISFRMLGMAQFLFVFVGPELSNLLGALGILAGFMIIRREL